MIETQTTPPDGEQPKSGEPAAVETQSVDAEVLPKETPAEEPRKKDSGRELRSGKTALERAWERDAAIAPKDGVVPISDKQAIKAAKLLGFSQKNWNVATLRAKRELGQFLTVPITARLVMVSNIDTLEQVNEVTKFAKKLAEDEGLAAKERLMAVGMVAAAGKVAGELGEQIMKLAEAAKDKDSNSGSKPKNLPPSAGIEMTLPDGNKITMVANSGSEK